MMKTVKEISEKYEQKIIDYRRYLHMHPELTNQEFRTAAWVREKLSQFGIRLAENIRGNSVVGYIDGKLPGPCIAFRGDMDALPIQEMNDVPYRSQNAGVMHACGHDAHTAILMGLAEALADNRDSVRGRVVFLFQQGEEGGKEAEKLVQDGALEGVDSVYGLHVGTAYPVGTISTGFGAQTASSDSFCIRIKGKSAHGAMPHQGVDPITAGCSIVSELNLIRSKLVDALEPFVVNVCQFNSGSAANIVPEEAVVKGTIRCFSEAVHCDVMKHIDKICGGICTMKGCTYQLTYDFITPGVFNAECETSLAIEAIKKQGFNVMLLPAQMVSEDFAYLSHKTPGCFFGLGAGSDEKGFTAVHHTPIFDIDEACLAVGLECMLAIYLEAVS